MVAQRRTVGYPPIRVRRHLLAALPFLVIAVLLATHAGSADAAPQQQGLAPASFTIVNPTGLAGPVGTNVTAKISGATKNHVFDIAYAPSSPGCTALGASSSTIPAVTIGGNGSAQFSFAWPADSGTGSFVLCAQDQQNPLAALQSQQAFDVLSASPPAITISPAPQPTPTGTQPTAPTSNPSGAYTSGESVIVQGTGFLPGGTSVQIGLASTPNGDSQIISQSPVNADTSGNFTITVTLPAYRLGNIYIQALTTDGGNNQPPSLLASAPITIEIAPTPTASPSPTATSTPAATPTPIGGTTTGGSSNNGGTLRILGIAGLGSFSVLLLLVGTALLISAGRSGEGMS